MGAADRRIPNVMHRLCVEIRSSFKPNSFDLSGSSSSASSHLGRFSAYARSRLSSSQDTPRTKNKSSTTHQLAFIAPHIIATASDHSIRTFDCRILDTTRSAASSSTTKTSTTAITKTAVAAAPKDSKGVRQLSASAHSRLLSKSSIPFVVTGIVANSQAPYLAVYGEQHCHVLLYDPRKGSRVDRIVLELGLEESQQQQQSSQQTHHQRHYQQLQTKSVIVDVSWLPYSDSRLAICTNKFVRIFDLATDVWSPAIGITSHEILAQSRRRKMEEAEAKAATASAVGAGGKEDSLHETKFREQDISEIAYAYNHSDQMYSAFVLLTDGVIYSVRVSLSEQAKMDISACAELLMKPAVLQKASVSSIYFSETLQRLFVSYNGTSAMSAGSSAGGVGVGSGAASGTTSMLGSYAMRLDGAHLQCVESLRLKVAAGYHLTSWTDVSGEHDLIACVAYRRSSIVASHLDDVPQIAVFQLSPFSTAAAAAGATAAKMRVYDLPTHNRIRGLVDATCVSLISTTTTTTPPPSSSSSSQQQQHRQRQPNRPTFSDLHRAGSHELCELGRSGEGRVGPKRVLLPISTIQTQLEPSLAVLQSNGSLHHLVIGGKGTAKLAPPSSRANASNAGSVVKREGERGEEGIRLIKMRLSNSSAAAASTVPLYQAAIDTAARSSTTLGGNNGDASPPPLPSHYPDFFAKLRKELMAAAAATARRTMAARRMQKLSKRTNSDHYFLSSSSSLSPYSSAASALFFSSLDGATRAGYEVKYPAAASDVDEDVSSMMVKIADKQGEVLRTHRDIEVVHVHVKPAKRRKKKAAKRKSEKAKKKKKRRRTKRASMSALVTPSEAGANQGEDDDEEEDSYEQDEKQQAEPVFVVRVRIKTGRYSRGSIVISAPPKGVASGQVGDDDEDDDDNYDDDKDDDKMNVERVRSEVSSATSSPVPGHLSVGGPIAPGVWHSFTLSEELSRRLSSPGARKGGNVFTLTLQRSSSSGPGAAPSSSHAMVIEALEVYTKPQKEFLKSVEGGGEKEGTMAAQEEEEEEEAEEEEEPLATKKSKKRRKRKKKKRRAEKHKQQQQQQQQQPQQMRDLIIPPFLQPEFFPSSSSSSSSTSSRRAKMENILSCTFSLIHAVWPVISGEGRHATPNSPPPLHAGEFREQLTEAICPLLVPVPWDPDPSGVLAGDDEREAERMKKNISKGGGNSDSKQAGYAGTSTTAGGAAAIGGGGGGGESGLYRELYSEPFRTAMYGAIASYQMESSPHESPPPFPYSRRSASRSHSRSSSHSSLSAHSRSPSNSPSRQQRQQQQQQQQQQHGAAIATLGIAPAFLRRENVGSTEKKSSSSMLHRRRSSSLSSSLSTCPPSSLSPQAVMIEDNGGHNRASILSGALQMAARKVLASMYSPSSPPSVSSKKDGGFRKNDGASSATISFVFDRYILSSFRRMLSATRELELMKKGATTATAAHPWLSSFTSSSSSSSSSPPVSMSMHEFTVPRMISSVEILAHIIRERPRHFARYVKANPGFIGSFLDSFGPIMLQKNITLAHRYSKAITLGYSACFVAAVDLWQREAAAAAAATTTTTTTTTNASQSLNASGDAKARIPPPPSLHEVETLLRRVTQLAYLCLCTRGISETVKTSLVVSLLQLLRSSHIESRTNALRSGRRRGSLQEAINKLKALTSGKKGEGDENLSSSSTSSSSSFSASISGGRPSGSKARKRAQQLETVFESKKNGPRSLGQQQHRLAPPPLLTAVPGAAAAKMVATGTAPLLLSSSSSASAAATTKVHYRCDECGKRITGWRWRCCEADICEDFDLCQECYPRSLTLSFESSNHNADHIMQRIQIAPSSPPPASQQQRNSEPFVVPSAAAASSSRGGGRGKGKVERWRQVRCEARKMEARKEEIQDDEFDCDVDDDDEDEARERTGLASSISAAVAAAAATAASANTNASSAGQRGSGRNLERRHRPRQSGLTLDDTRGRSSSRRIGSIGHPLTSLSTSVTKTDSLGAASTGAGASSPKTGDSTAGSGAIMSEKEMMIMQLCQQILVPPGVVDEKAQLKMAQAISLGKKVHMVVAQPAPSSPLDKRRRSRQLGRARKDVKSTMLHILAKILATGFLRLPVVVPPKSNNDNGGVGDNKQQRDSSSEKKIRDSDEKMMEVEESASKMAGSADNSVQNNASPASSPPPTSRSERKRKEAKSKKPLAPEQQRTTRSSSRSSLPRPVATAAPPKKRAKGEESRSSDRNDETAAKIAIDEKLQEWLRPEELSDQLLLQKEYFRQPPPLSLLQQHPLGLSLASSCQVMLFLLRAPAAGQGDDEETSRRNTHVITGADWEGGDGGDDDDDDDRDAVGVVQVKDKLKIIDALISCITRSHEMGLTQSMTIYLGVLRSAMDAPLSSLSKSHRSSGSSSNSADAAATTTTTTTRTLSNGAPSKPTTTGLASSSLSAIMAKKSSNKSSSSSGGKKIFAAAAKTPSLSSSLSRLMRMSVVPAAAKETAASSTGTGVTTCRKKQPSNSRKKQSSSSQPAASPLQDCVRVEIFSGRGGGRSADSVKRAISHHIVRHHSGFGKILHTLMGQYAQELIRTDMAASPLQPSSLASSQQQQQQQQQSSPLGGNKRRMAVMLMLMVADPFFNYVSAPPLPFSKEKHFTARVAKRF
eukprot:jgi/Bigna1/141118/aug1.60_g15826